MEEGMRSHLIGLLLATGLAALWMPQVVTAQPGEPRIHPGDRQTAASPDSLVSQFAPPGATVGIVRSDNSQLPVPVPSDQPLTVQQVEDLVRAAVRHAGGLAQMLEPDARIVVIKTNLVEVKKSGDGTVTDWRVVRAVARLVHEIAPDARVKVIESCNWDEPGGEGWKEDGWGYAGYDQLDSLGYVELVNMNFDSTYAKPIPGGGLVRDEFQYPVVMDSVDCFIDAPVVKIIGTVGLTAAMKNLVGMVPNTGDAHRNDVIDHSNAYLDEGIIDLNLLHPVDFVVADAIVGVERAKTTTWDGQPVRLNTVLASADVVAADAVAARLIGLNPDDIEYLGLAQKLGMGVAETEHIDVRGDAVERIGRRFEKMKSLYERYGQTPRDWVLKGPFPASSSDEDFLDPRGLVVVPGEDGWSQPVYTSADRVNIKKYLGRPQHCAVYSYTEFEAQRDEPAHLWVGSGEAMTVWIDGEEVYSFDGRRRHKVPNEQHHIQVSAGRHGLLVKLYQTIGSFDFSLNICEAEDDPRYSGNRVAGLRFSLPGGVTAEIPRSGSKEGGVSFDLGDWLTRRTFDLDIEEVIDSRHGLPEDGIHQIDFDAEGRLWVATEEGVYCRTGDTTWTVYGEDEGVRTGWVRELMVNPRDDNVWVSIRGKLHQYDGDSWQVHFPDNWHGSIFTDNEGNTCASVWQNGVRCYDEGKWISYRQYDENGNHANWAEVGAFDARGTLWVGTWGHGVLTYDGETWEQFGVRQGMADNHPIRIAIAPNGDVWTTFACPGISRYRRGKWKSYYDDGAPDSEVGNLLITRTGTVWAATQGGRPDLSRFDGKHWAAASCGGRIEDMIEAEDGRIWLATRNSVVALRLE